MRVALTLLLMFLLFGHSAMADTVKRAFDVRVNGADNLPKMLLIPGLASSADVWRSTVAHYKGKFQTHTLTLAGFAGVPLRGEPSLDKVTEDIVDYIQQYELNKPVIVGHSLGGFLALRLGIEAPELVGKLVIVDSLPFLAGVQNPTATEKSVEPVARQMRQGMLAVTDDKAFETRQRQTLMTMVQDSKDLEMTVGWSMTSDRKMVAGAMYQMMVTDLRETIAKIQSETLILGSWAAFKAYGGTEAITRGIFERQFKALNNKTLLMAPDAFHFIMLDSPQWMLAQTDNFLL